MFLSRIRAIKAICSAHAAFQQLFAAPIALQQESCGKSVKIQNLFARSNITIFHLISTH
jgi:hypothetical protein